MNLDTKETIIEKLKDLKQNFETLRSTTDFMLNLYEVSVFSKEDELITDSEQELLDCLNELEDSVDLAMTQLDLAYELNNTAMEENEEDEDDDDEDDDIVFFSSLF